MSEEQSYGVQLAEAIRNGVVTAFRANYKEFHLQYYSDALLGAVGGLDALDDNYSRDDIAAEFVYVEDGQVWEINFTAEDIDQAKWDGKAWQIGGETDLIALTQSEFAPAKPKRGPAL